MAADQLPHKMVLIVEDVDHKFEEVKAVLQQELGNRLAIARATTVVEAQAAIEDRDWDLIIVDISMDIAKTKETRIREAHANLGGMDIIEQMYLLERDALTVIVTGFDYFVRSDRDAGTQEAQTFADLGDQARKWLGEKFLGSIRYGSQGWQAELSKNIRGKVP